MKEKLYILLRRTYINEGVIKMEAAKRLNKENGGEEDLGLMMWKLESIGQFYRCDKTMMEKE